MKITEITENDMKAQEHWKRFHTELPGVKLPRDPWSGQTPAPYEVRRIERADGVWFVVFSSSHKVAEARLAPSGDYIIDLLVLPEHRRRGIATALYRYIEQQIGRPLKPSPLHQTNAGKAFWQSRGHTLR